MKLGRQLDQLKRLLNPLALAGMVEVYAVSNCGLEDERIYFSLEEIPERVAYLTTVIVKQSDKKNKKIL